jgi:hypothetical protein
MNNIKTLNCKCTLEALPPTHGMIDAHAYHSSVTTWPIPLAYVQINPANEREPVHFTDVKTAMDKLKFVDGENISLSRHRGVESI